MTQPICIFTRHFSDIEGLQTAHTLTYTLEAAPAGPCRMVLRRTGARECSVSQSVAASPTAARRLLQFFCENAVQPELWRDLVAEYAGVWEDAPR